MEESKITKHIEIPSSNPMKKLSKYVLAEIIDFLPSREVLPIRELSQKHRTAVSYIWSRRVKEISLILTYFQKELESSFTAKEIIDYKTILTTNATIKNDLSLNAKLANEGTNMDNNNHGIGLYPNKSIAYLKKPFPTIIYPAYFVWILLGKQIFKEQDDDPQIIWQKVKSIYKDPELEKKMTNIKISSVTQKMINVIQGIINDNAWYMNYNILRNKNGVTVAYLFEWTLSIIQYYEVYRKLKKSSMQQLTDKIHKYGANLKQLQSIYDNILKKDFDL